MRIMIFGRPGSGKSTTATRLGKLLALPVYHLDKYFFVENWKERNYQEFLQIQQDLVNHDSWIIDGNATKSLEMRYARAQVVLYFNYPRPTCLWRLFKRTWRKDVAIQDRAAGCHENVRWQLVKYMWGFDERVQDVLVNLKNSYPDVQICTITNDRELKTVVQEIAKRRA